MHSLFLLISKLFFALTNVPNKEEIVQHS